VMYIGAEEYLSYEWERKMEWNQEW
jgi:hypothetical protein